MVRVESPNDYWLLCTCASLPSRFFEGLAGAQVSTAPSPAAAPRRTPTRLTTPMAEWGHNIGDDYFLADYQQLIVVLEKLEKESLSAQWHTLHQQGATTWCTRGTGPARRDGCTTSRSRPTPARTSCGRRTSALTAGCFIETGPHKHAIQQTFFLYV